MKRVAGAAAKSVVVIIGIVLAVLVIASVITVFAVRSSLIGTEAAEEIAITDAGVEPPYCKTGLALKDGHFQYEVEFYVEGIEYDYVIQAKDGEILLKDTHGTGIKPQDAATEAATEAETTVTETTAPETTVSETTTSTTTAETTAQTTSTETTTVAASGLTLDEAKAVALKDAGVSESDATFTESRRETDNGIDVYVLAFSTDDKAYEYKIGAEDGSIRKRSEEAVGEAPAEGETIAVDSNDPKVEHARVIALSGAGLMDKQADIVFTEIRQDTRDGKIIYEMKFYYEDTEYEYTVSEHGEVMESSSKPKED